uniref:3-phosphoshikimate 1-carboxyvinyltransferase n=1 Tax=uncultured marine group II/III euryarchaeote AD1000_34_D01 TaxID=1457757 RepID=A0A075FVB2_9EURY|nr:3-phosphoshikimate 1-carboxyvinyltransferase (aroA) [uncultured marine group II/III euryarchaeote AD1000_34_D01]
MAIDVAGLENWKPWFSPPGGEGRGGNTRIQPVVVNSPVSWPLAPSKSHMIRWLLLASQGEKSVEIRFEGTPGEDIVAMARCLIQMGVEIDVDVAGARETGIWTVHGVGAHGFSRPISVLNCSNSGTTLRLLTVAAARLDEPVMVDGDRTLRRRHSETLVEMVRGLGAVVSHGTGLESMPYLVNGPISAANLTLNVAKSSQPLSALLLSMPALDGDVKVDLLGNAVSRRHAHLSFELAFETGSENLLTFGDSQTLKPWSVDCPENVTVPADRSLESFGMLYATVNGVELEVPNRPDDKDSLGAELLSEISVGGDEEGDNSPQEIDLRDANDLLPPLAAILALKRGGRITGAAHARHKESNRIEKSVELLGRFGIVAVATDDGLKVEGGQTINSPDGTVETHSDHRLWMTAACLASKVGATLSHEETYSVSDPDFLSRIV